MSDPDTPDSGADVDRSIPDALSSLYQEVILDHYRSPRNKEEMEDATHDVTMNNPLCGDVVELQLEMAGDRIDRAAFQGRGCSISQAAASMLTGELEGKSVAEALELTDKFTRLMHGETELSKDESLGDLRALAGVAKFPVRIKCALLGFNCLEELVGEGEDAGDGGDPGGGEDR